MDWRVFRGRAKGKRDGVSVQTDTIETRIPARLDRLPWSRFHWLVVIGLGTVWILDGLEVTIVGSVASRLTEKGSGIVLNAGQIGVAASVYVAGACIGALFFGQLTDRFGRKKLFITTLAVYITATVATAFAFDSWYFYAARFFTGAGIGGEYAAINSAIDELIPARLRGRVDLMINGSYWVGSMAGSAAALFFLSSVFPKDIGWRVSFGVGALLGLTIMFVRRNVPESPRWLFIHGREEEAEAIVDGIERDVSDETGQELTEPDKRIEVRQRESIPFREIARTGFKLYPSRAVLGLALFVGQAFIYNGITFNLGTLFSGFYGVSSSFVPVFIIIYAAGNFLGPLLLGRLFDTVGRKPMIAGTYLASAALGALLAYLFAGNSLGSEWWLEALIVATFFFASAGASAAYLTVSEIFPMETRALAIAFFYAVGTGAGGIVGPVLFGRLIGSGDRGQVAIAFYIGAAVMAVGGLAEIVLGVRAEGEQLEDIAKPLTVEEAEQGGGEREPSADEERDGRGDEGARCRAKAEDERANALEHRARAHELRAAASSGDGDAAARVGLEEELAQIADLRAQALDERAAAAEEDARAERSAEDAERRAAEQLADAARERAEAFERSAAARAAADDGEERRQQALADAAAERGRAREQHAAAESAGAAAEQLEGAAAAVEEARARVHERWATTHEARARQAEPAAGQDREAGRGSAVDGADAAAEEALAAEERLHAAEHRREAEELRAQGGRAQEASVRERRAAEAERTARERERRLRERLERRRARERQGLRRFRPGPGRTLYAPHMAGLRFDDERYEESLDREIETIGRALEERGATSRGELATIVGARYWGPGVFRTALREAVRDGRAVRLSRSSFGPPEHPAAGGDAPEGV
jgi:MFS family permease